MGAGLMQMAYLAVLVLFAPWTVVLLPITGIWYILFLSQFFLYKSMRHFVLRRSLREMKWIIQRNMEPVKPENGNLSYIKRKQENICW